MTRNLREQRRADLRTRRRFVRARKMALPTALAESLAT